MKNRMGSVWDRAWHRVGLSKCHFPLPTFVPWLLMSVLTTGTCTWAEEQMVREGVEQGEGGLGGGLPWLVRQMPREALCGSIIRRPRSS